ncbi:ABC transporter substrate-binding protein [Paenibacillus aceris]|uniref:Raffinose/stachyose/melibiose transport system substrate-binding protein n=1 Tax=Paenibacillus aceris TaxID=869555 RepID=A0ABS4HYH9_9BACL|nr:extracellular solute-binding protein [Paenibacillus aceris]MBP1963386.1 raffinose/stachyose/melibiose transport system substrate-binding protein [Paenibacillus aceris]NHW36107.1 extracellular solute-binding protein [Paenibacillus aceris]
MFKKPFFTVTALMLVSSLALMGCSSSTNSNSASSASPAVSASPAGDKTTPTPSKQDKVMLSAFMYVTSPAGQDAYTQIARDFEQQNPNIQVDLQFPGDYENVLKVKMAANELPDVFDTHGWAQIRYGKYLTDLKAESWVPQMTDTIKDVVTDKSGKVYVLPISEAKDGISYNVNVLKKYNVDVPKTIDEFLAAADKIKSQSNGDVTPFYYAGADNWTVGQFFDEFASPLLISPKENSASALLDGSFDWTKWTPLPAKFKEMFDKGYMNKDVITAKYTDLAKLFATDKVAFFMGGPSFADDAYKVNKDTKIGIMPVPSMVAGDEPSFSGGERDTMGVWKDSKHIDEAKKLLAFYAKPENMAKIANVMKLPAGLKGVTATHEFASFYDQYSSIRVFPYFDRVYLPSGMWDVMCNSGLDLIAGHITPAKYSDVMKENVARLNRK